MKNKNFFYLQYNKINWENQEETKINYKVNDFLIKNILLKNSSSKIKIFDIGFGVGFFLKMLFQELPKKYDEILISGCEPSNKNYNNFIKNKLTSRKNLKLEFYKSTFQEINLKEKFDFLTAIYVFPHFSSEDLEVIVKKIYSMLEPKGKFVLVIANEKYLDKKLKDEKDLFIESNTIEFNNKKYKEILHYSDLPKIGKIIDYNREEKYYLDLFKKNGFNIIKSENLDDNGFICNILVFEKS